MNKDNKHTFASRAKRFAGLFLLFGVFLSVFSSEVFAQVPPANTQIGNQASATYIDNGGNSQSITSNTVQTIVQQVAGVDITQGIVQTVSPGGQVSFKHTITNTGNGVDSFTLSPVEGTGAFNFDNIVIYPDANEDGVPDSFTPITSTPNIDPPGTSNGNSYGIVIVADIPVTASEGDVETIQITATSVFNTSVADAATNTTNVDEDAVINVDKSRDKQFVEVGDTVTFTFSYAESGGSSNGTNLVIKDPLPAGVTYVPNSGQWSGATGTPLTDSNTGETATGITYEFDATGVADSVIVQIANINAGASGTVSFKVTVNSGQEGNQIFNTGTYFHDDAPTPITTTTSITVNEEYGIEAVGADTVFVTDAEQGAIVNFLNVFVNTGTATDRYNITLSNGNFPSGTSPTFYQVDANNQPTSPYTDTNNDGIDDTGPVAVGDTIKVILQMNLPSGQSGGPFSITKTLTSVNDPSKNDFHIDALGEILTPTVDITNDQDLDANPSAPGAGEGPETLPVTTEAANPGSVVNFTLFINNTSSQDDSYDLSLASDTTAGGDLLNPGTLPSGWTANFRDPNNGYSVITNTGNIPAGTSKEIQLRVNVPAGYQPGQVEIYARALSQITGAKDIKHEAVNVATVRQITLVNNQTAQVSPGGSVDYLHTLTVNSNVDENIGGSAPESDFRLELVNSVPTGWTAVVYWDTDGNGVVTSADTLLTSAAAPGSVDLPASVGTLQYGDQVKFIVQVTASTGLNDGATVTSTLTISDNNSQVASVVNNDQTEVQAGRLAIDKFQAPDASGTPGTFTKSNFNVLPGDTVWYKIVVVNDGSEPVTNVVVQDNVPSYTKIASVATYTIDNGTIPGIILDSGNPGIGQAGVVKVTAPQLDPTEQFTVIFAVKVDN